MFWECSGCGVFLLAKKRGIKKNKQLSKDFVYISVISVLALVLAAIMLGKLSYPGKGDYEIKNLTISSITPSDGQDKEKILKIANSNEEVRGYVLGREYSVEIFAVTDDDKAKMPAVYGGLEGRLYKVVYSMGGMDLLVVTDDEKVLKVLPVTKLSIG